MPDYKKAVIYMLEPSIQYDEGDIYYGSTTQPLYKRFFAHKASYNYGQTVRSKILFEKYGIENIKIILIKYFSCENKQELEAEEAKYIRENKCVNYQIPCRSKKEYYLDNKEKLNKQNNENYEKKKGIFKEKRKEYRETNKEKFKEYRKDHIKEYQERDKKYYEINKENILEKMKEKIKCDCGCEVSKGCLKRHQKSKKHTDLIIGI
jgi:hypothetical protein